jgi:hypothetical protein
MKCCDICHGLKEDSELNKVVITMKVCGECASNKLTVVGQGVPLSGVAQQASSRPARVPYHIGGEAMFTPPSE